MNTLTILCIGDIVGRPGRTALKRFLGQIQAEHHVNFTIANIENAATGSGFTEKIYEELRRLPIQAFTGGNHIFRQKEVLPIFDTFTLLSRPLNWVEGTPGQGIRYYKVNGQRIAVVSLIGRIFMDPSESPFQAIKSALPELREKADHILVDIHAEATSEKQAMGFFLDGKVTAVFGTHTHVQTADNRLLPNGTAYITDLGMTGTQDSVLGVQKDRIINRFLSPVGEKFENEENGPVMINGIVITIELSTGKPLEINRVYQVFAP